MKWSIDDRRATLAALHQQITLRTDDICAALWSDLHKNRGEAYMTEIGLVLHEIELLRKNMGRWLKPRKVGMPIALWPSKGVVVREPYGRVLIVAPWNYPFQLVMLPLVGAVSAGNSVVVKASPEAPATQRVLNEILTSVFEANEVRMEIGGVERMETLLAERWDYIFFTGSAATGRVVARAAAENLTPMTLELGGKSPCVVGQNANLKIAARRIVWGKFLNAGQTCVAPDYLFVHRSVVDELESLLRSTVVDMFGVDASASPLYGRIVNDRSFDRLVALCPDVVNDRSDRYISPTVVRIDSTEDRLMGGEIFGPILPILTYDNIEQVMSYVNGGERPLALYYFGDKEQAQAVIDRCDSGGVCVNDTVMQSSTPSLPFGGVGGSGMGCYHGRFSIQTFSRQRSILKNITHIDIKTRYNPLSNISLIKYILK